MQHPIVIQGAMKSETDWLIAETNATREETVGGFRFYRGSYRGISTVIAKTMIGEICAAVSTTIAIQRYAPCLIINQGTAGAHSKELEVGDTVLGSSLRYLSDFSTAGDAETEPLNPWKRDGYRTVDGEQISLSPDHVLTEALRGIAFDGGKTLTGVIGSGDVWTRHPDLLRHYKDQYGTHCEEMEAVGACLAANSFGIPFLALRVISNNELTNAPFDPRAGLWSQQRSLRAAEYLQQSRRIL